MKVLFINVMGDPAKGGGAEQTLWTLMRGLRDAGHQCVLLATSAGRGLIRSEQEDIVVWQAGIRNLYWPDPGNQHKPVARTMWHVCDSYNPWMQHYFREVVAAERPDVASLHNLPGWSAATWATLDRLGIPTVQVLHDYYAICAKSTMYKQGCNCTGQCASCAALRLPHRALSRKVTAVVGVSRYVLETHCRLGYFEGVPIQKVIHNARSPVSLGCDGTYSRSVHSGVRFGFIGTLAPNKGLAQLLEAFLRADLQGSELWVAGAGKPDYERGLRAMGNDARIHFLGRVKPVDFFPQVDVVVVPSLWNDNLPGVVFESFAFGKPVLAARRGGIPEMVRDGENGMLFDPDRPDELVAALRRSAADAGLQQKMAETAKASALPFLDIKRWVESYLKTYEAALSVQVQRTGT